MYSVAFIYLFVINKNYHFFEYMEMYPVNLTKRKLHPYITVKYTAWIEMTKTSLVDKYRVEQVRGR